MSSSFKQFMVFKIWSKTKEKILMNVSLVQFWTFDSLLAMKRKVERQLISKSYTYMYSKFTSTLILTFYHDHKQSSFLIFNTVILQYMWVSICNLNHLWLHIHTYIYIYIYMCVCVCVCVCVIWFGWVIWHINPWRLFNAKSSLYIYIKYIWFSLVWFYGISTIVDYLMPNPL